MTANSPSPHAVSQTGRLAPRPWMPGDDLPEVGSQALVSGVHADVESDQHRAYSWRTVVGYGEGENFICLQATGCWPTVERTENCWFAEIKQVRRASPADGVVVPREAVALTLSPMRPDAVARIRKIGDWEARSKASAELESAISRARIIRAMEVQIPMGTAVAFLAALTTPPSADADKLLEVTTAARELLDACYAADENSDLSDFIDGMLMTRLDKALARLSTTGAGG